MRQPHALIPKPQLIRVFILVLTVACASCGSDDDGGGTPTNPTPPPQGPATLQIVDLVVGTGDEAGGTEQVQIHYTLWLYDPAGTDGKGTRIESSRNGSQPIQFRLGSNAVIPGFEQGVVGTKVGGTRRLTIPPNLGYGASGQGPIPGNSWLVFEIELMATAP